MYVLVSFFGQGHLDRDDLSDLCIYWYPFLDKIFPLDPNVVGISFGFYQVSRYIPMVIVHNNSAYSNTT